MTDSTGNTALLISSAIDDFDRAPIAGAHLKEIGETGDALGSVRTGCVEQRRIEKQRVPLFQRQLHVVGLEIGPEILEQGREVARQEGLRIRQQFCRAALNRHVAMRDCALESQRRREPVGVGGIALELLEGLESHVIVPVRRLRGSAGIDDIYLGGDLIQRPKPRPTDERNDRIGIVTYEYMRIRQAQFFVRVPNSGIRAHLPKMIPLSRFRRGLGVDDRLQDHGHFIDNRGVRIGMFEDQGAWAVRQDRVPFRKHVSDRCGRVRVSRQCRWTDRSVSGPQSPPNSDTETDPACVRHARGSCRADTRRATTKSAGLPQRGCPYSGSPALRRDRRPCWLTTVVRIEESCKRLHKLFAARALFSQFGRLRTGLQHRRLLLWCAERASGPARSRISLHGRMEAGLNWRLGAVWAVAKSDPELVDWNPRWRP